MELNDYKAKLKSGSLGGIYIFAGEEDYLKRHYLGELRSLASGDRSLAVFNHAVFDGAEINFSELFEAVKSPPMMSDYKLIEWKNANFNTLKDSELELFLDLIGMLEDHPYAVVAFMTVPDGFDAKTKKKSKRNDAMRKIQSETNFLLFDRSSENQLYAWLKRHFDAEGVEVDMNTLRALLFRSGKNMDNLEKEVQKLAFMAHQRGQKAVTPEMVNEAASSTPECDTFAFSNAISERNKPLAYAALLEMKAQRIDPAVVIGMMSRTYSELLMVSQLLAEGMRASDIEARYKINTYKLRHMTAAVKRYGNERLAQIMSALTEMDASSKFGGIAGYTAIEIFVSTYL